MLKKILLGVALALSLTGCVVHIGNLTDDEKASLLDLQGIGKNRHNVLLFAAQEGLQYDIYRSYSLASLQDFVLSCKTDASTGCQPEKQITQVATSMVIPESSVDSNSRAYFIDGCPTKEFGSSGGIHLDGDGVTYKYEWRREDEDNAETAYCYRFATSTIPSATSGATEILASSSGMLRNDDTAYYVLWVQRPKNAGGDGTKVFSYIHAITPRPPKEPEFLEFIGSFIKSEFATASIIMQGGGYFPIFDQCVPGDKNDIDGSKTSCTTKGVQHDDGMLEYQLYFSNLPLSECNYLEKPVCQTLNMQKNGYVTLTTSAGTIAHSPDDFIFHALKNKIISENNQTYYGVATNTAGFAAPTEATPNISLPIYMMASVRNNFGSSGAATGSQEVVIRPFELDPNPQDKDLLMTFDSKVSETASLLPQLRGFGGGNISPSGFLLSYLEDNVANNTTNDPNNNDVVDLNATHPVQCTANPIPKNATGTTNIISYSLSAKNACGATLINGVGYWFRLFSKHTVQVGSSSTELYRLSMVYRATPTVMPATPSLKVALSDWKEPSLRSGTAKLVPIISPSYDYQYNRDRSIKYGIYYCFSTENCKSLVGTGFNYLHQQNIKDYDNGTLTVAASSISISGTDMVWGANNVPSANDIKSFLRIPFNVAATNLTNTNSASFIVVATTLAGSLQSNPAEVSRFSFRVNSSDIGVDFKWYKQFTKNASLQARYAICVYNATPTIPTNLEVVADNVDQFCFDTGTKNSFFATYGVNLSNIATLGTTSGATSFTLSYDYVAKIVAYENIDVINTGDLINSGNEYLVSQIATFRTVPKPKSPIIAPYWTSYTEPATSSGNLNYDVIVLATPLAKTSFATSPPIIYELYYSNYATSVWATREVAWGAKLGDYCDFSITVDNISNTNSTGHAPADNTVCLPLPEALAKGSTNRFLDYKKYQVKDTLPYPYIPFTSGATDSRFKFFYMLAINSYGANQSFDVTDIGSSRISLKRFSLATELVSSNDPSIKIKWATPEYDSVLNKFGASLIPLGYRVFWSTSVAKIDTASYSYANWNDLDFTISGLKDGETYYMKVASGFATNTTITSTPLWLLSEIIDSTAYALPATPTIKNVWVLEDKYKNSEKKMGPVYKGLNSLPVTARPSSYHYRIEWVPNNDSNAVSAGYMLYAYTNPASNYPDPSECAIDMPLTRSTTSATAVEISDIPLTNNCINFADVDRQYSFVINAFNTNATQLSAYSDKATIQAPSHEPYNARTSAIWTTATINASVLFDIVDSSIASYTYSLIMHENLWSNGNAATCSFISTARIPIVTGTKNECGKTIYYPLTVTSTPNVGVLVSFQASLLDNYVFFTGMSRTAGEHAYLKSSTSSPTPDIVWQVQASGGASAQHSAVWTDHFGITHPVVEGVLPIVIPVVKPSSSSVFIQVPKLPTQWTTNTSSTNGKNCGFKEGLIYVSDRQLNISTIASNAFDTSLIPNSFFMHVQQANAKELQSGSVNIPMSTPPFKAGKTYYFYSFFSDNCIDSSKVSEFTIKPDPKNPSKPSLFPSLSIPKSNLPTATATGTFGQVTAPTLYGTHFTSSNLLHWNPLPSNAIPKDTYYILYHFPTDKYVSPRQVKLGKHPICDYTNIRYNPTDGKFYNTVAGVPGVLDTRCDPYISGVATGPQSFRYHSTQVTSTYIIISSPSTTAVSPPYSATHTWSNDVTLGPNLKVQTSPQNKPPVITGCNSTSPPLTNCANNKIPGVPIVCTSSTNCSNVAPVCPVGLPCPNVPKECIPGDLANPNYPKPNPACIDENGDGKLDVVYHWLFINNPAVSSVANASACFPGDSGGNPADNLYSSTGHGEFPNPTTSSTPPTTMNYRNSQNCKFESNTTLNKELNKNFDGILRITDTVKAQIKKYNKWWFVMNAVRFPSGGPTLPNIPTPSTNEKSVLYGNPYFYKVHPTISDDGISIGYDHGCFVGTKFLDRQVYCWGDGRYGQWGIGLSGGSSWTTNATKAVKIGTTGATLKNVVEISSGPQVSCAVSVSGGNGQLYCWGRNDFFNHLVGFNLGGKQTNIDQPFSSFARKVTLPSNISDVKKVSVGQGAICVTGSSGGGSYGGKAANMAYCWASEDVYTSDGLGAIRYSTLATSLTTDDNNTYGRAIFKDDNSSYTSDTKSEFIDISVAKFFPDSAAYTEANVSACAVARVKSISSPSDFTNRTYCWGISDTSARVSSGVANLKPEQQSPIIVPPRLISNAAIQTGGIDASNQKPFNFIVGLQGKDNNPANFKNFPSVKAELDHAISLGVYPDGNPTNNISTASLRATTDTSFSNPIMVSVGNKIACSAVDNGSHGADAATILGINNTYKGGESILCWGYEGQNTTSSQDNRYIQRMGVTVGGADSSAKYGPRRIANNAPNMYDCALGADVAVPDVSYFQRPGDLTLFKSIVNYQLSHFSIDSILSAADPCTVSLIGPQRWINNPIHAKLTGGDAYDLYGTQNKITGGTTDFQRLWNAPPNTTNHATIMLTQMFPKPSTVKIKSLSIGENHSCARIEGYDNYLPSMITSTAACWGALSPNIMPGTDPHEPKAMQNHTLSGDGSVTNQFNSGEVSNAVISLFFSKSSFLIEAINWFNSYQRMLFTPKNSTDKDITSAVAPYQIRLDSVLVEQSNSYKLFDVTHLDKLKYRFKKYPMRGVVAVDAAYNNTCVAGIQVPDDTDNSMANWKDPNTTNGSPSLYCWGSWGGSNMHYPAKGDPRPPAIGAQWVNSSGNNYGCKATKSCDNTARMIKQQADPSGGKAILYEPKIIITPSPP